MKKDKISEAIGMIDEKYVYEASAFAASENKEEKALSDVRSGFIKVRPSRSRWGIVAACLVFALVMGSASFAVAAEAREYNTAMAFFEENGLSTEGLSRSEIKELYREITAKSFTHIEDKEIDVQKREGVLNDNFSYLDDQYNYYFTDMVEFEGRVYLSAYSVPKQEDEGGRHEIANVLDYVSSKGPGVPVTSEELTPIVRDNYDALLLVCESEGDTPKIIRSEKGGLGGKLSVNEAGQIEWEVESITAAFYSQATSFFTIGGTCRVFSYTFDKSGSLIEEKDTGVTVPYRR